MTAINIASDLALPSALAGGFGRVLTERVLVDFDREARAWRFDDSLLNPAEAGDLASRLRALADLVEAAERALPAPRKRRRGSARALDAAGAVTEALAAARTAAERTADWVAHLEAVLDRLQLDLVRLTRLSAKSADLARSLTAPIDPEDQELQDRFHRRRVNLASLIGANRCAIEQLRAVIARQSELLDRFALAETCLSPAWRRQVMTLAKAPASDERLGAARAAARTVLGRLLEG
jgi:hypothetical protein